MVALYVTLAPAQTAPEGLASMDTATAAMGVTAEIRVLEVAGLLEVQLIEEVSMHCTWSPSWGVKVKVLLFVPASRPFTFH